jgi:hypothetical protein
MITLTFAVKEVEMILAALRKLPMEVAEELVSKTRQQAIPQVQQAAQAAQTQDVAPSAAAPATDSTQSADTQAQPAQSQS